jgi:hypothetical protein
MRLDPEISASEALTGVFALTDRRARRIVYGRGFPHSLLNEL